MVNNSECEFDMFKGKTGRPPPSFPLVNPSIKNKIKKIKNKIK